MEHPDLRLMYLQAERQIEQQKREHARTLMAPGPLSTIRALTGNALIALGTRIAPAPRALPTVPVRPRLATGR
jgi:hypothetical protein